MVVMTCRSSRVLKQPGLHTPNAPSQNIRVAAHARATAGITHMMIWYKILR